MKKRLAIFGAGEYGRKALSYYGADQIECFIDNNCERWGSCIDGIKVLSLDLFINLNYNCEIAIAISEYKSIVDQLRQAGVVDFFVFSPSHQRRIESLHNEIILGSIAVFGTGELSTTIIKFLRRACITENVEILTSKVLENSFGYQTIEEKGHLFRNIIIAEINSHFAWGTYCSRWVSEDANVIDPFAQRKYYETEDLIYNPYGDNGRERSEEEWNSLAAKSINVEEMNHYVNELAMSRPLFELVEIETVNKCNGRCSFCPVSVGNDIRETLVMDEKLFFRIIDQLAEINYRGRLSTFSNNEPFIDDRIVMFNRYARKKLPNARMHLFTNGTLLTIKKFIEIIDYLDELIIDNYNQELELNQNLESIKDYCEEHVELKKKVTIVMRREDEILTSRGGDAPNRRKKVSYPHLKCDLPYREMIIRPDGKVSLCCNDPYGRSTLGDLTKDNIMEIWNGSAFESVRKAILVGRGELEHCVYCDTCLIF